MFKSMRLQAACCHQLSAPLRHFLSGSCSALIPSLACTLPCITAGPPSPPVVSAQEPDMGPTGTPAPLQAPQQLDSAYELLPELSMVVAVHLAHIPGTDRYLYMERPSGYHPDNSHNIAGSFDLATRTWRNLDSPDGLFCCGHTLMSNGSIAIVGGHVANAGYPAGIQSVRTYTDGQPALIKATTMRYPRW